MNLLCAAFGIWCAAAPAPAVAAPDGIIVPCDNPEAHCKVIWNGANRLLCKAPDSTLQVGVCTDDSPYVFMHSDGTPGPAAKSP